MAIFFACSISSRHLCWDIPGAPWQGRMCGFPFQTGLLCPSHHQGSLLKYVPSVKAWGWRVDGMEQRRQRGKEVKERCLRLPVAHSLGVQWQAGFLLRSMSALTEAEITRVCLNVQKRRRGLEATPVKIPVKSFLLPTLPTNGDMALVHTPVLAPQSQQSRTS